MNRSQKGSVRSLLLDGSARLARSGIPTAEFDAELLLSTLIGRSRPFLLAHPDFLVPEKAAAKFEAWIQKRSQRYPLQYLRGHQEFYGRQFWVTEDVLIPRPETELLVEVSLELTQVLDRPRLLDLGTGCGCIAISLACEKPDSRVHASDLSPAALRVARSNAAQHGVGDAIRFHQGRSLKPFSSNLSFDLIVSNPPYVSFKDKAIEPEVGFEPTSAVFAGLSGLEVVTELLDTAQHNLLSRGLLVLEVGNGQCPMVIKLAEQRNWALCQKRKDLAGIERCVAFRRKA